MTSIKYRINYKEQYIRLDRPEGIIIAKYKTPVANIYKLPIINIHFEIKDIFIINYTQNRTLKFNNSGHIRIKRPYDTNFYFELNNNRKVNTSYLISNIDGVLKNINYKIVSNNIKFYDKHMFFELTNRINIQINPNKPNFIFNNLKKCQYNIIKRIKQSVDIIRVLNKLSYRKQFYLRSILNIKTDHHHLHEFQTNKLLKIIYSLNGFSKSKYDIKKEMSEFNHRIKKIANLKININSNINLCLSNNTIIKFSIGTTIGTTNGIFEFCNCLSSFSIYQYSNLNYNNDHHLLNWLFKYLKHIDQLDYFLNSLEEIYIHKL